MRIRTINLGYNLPANVLAKAGISSLRVYATVVNPFILWSPIVRQGLAVDPEGNGYGGVATSTAAGENVTARAITVNLNNPPTRTFQLGVNLKF